MSTEIESLVSAFVMKLVAAVEAASIARARAAVESAFGSPGPGVLTSERSVAKSGRPKQICPVPGCTGVAAPIFGMVCREHKKVAKSKIAKYRKDRKQLSRQKMLLNATYGKVGGWSVEAATVEKKTRKPRAKVLCPVPGCKKVAASIFGMVCSDHQDVSKTKIAKYRKERKAAKLGGSKRSKKIQSVIKKTVVLSRKKPAKLAVKGKGVVSAKKVAVKSKLTSTKTVKRWVKGSDKSRVKGADKFVDKGKDKKQVKKAPVTVADGLDKKADKVRVTKVVDTVQKGGSKGAQKVVKAAAKKGSKKVAKGVSKKAVKKVVKTSDLSADPKVEMSGGKDLDMADLASDLDNDWGHEHVTYQDDDY